MWHRGRPYGRGSVSTRAPIHKPPGLWAVPAPPAPPSSSGINARRCAAWVLSFIRSHRAAWRARRSANSRRCAARRTCGAAPLCIRHTRHTSDPFPRRLCRVCRVLTDTASSSSPKPQNPMGAMTYGDGDSGKLVARARATKCARFLQKGGPTRGCTPTPLPARETCGGGAGATLIRPASCLAWSRPADVLARATRVLSLSSPCRKQAPENADRRTAERTCTTQGAHRCEQLSPRGGLGARRTPSWQRRGRRIGSERYAGCVDLGYLDHRFLQGWDPRRAAARWLCARHHHDTT